MAKAAPITAANVDDAGPSAVREHHLHPLWAARTVPPLLPPWMESLSQVSETAVCGIMTFYFPPGARKTCLFLVVTTL